MTIRKTISNSIMGDVWVHDDSVIVVENLLLIGSYKAGIIVTCNLC